MGLFSSSYFRRKDVTHLLRQMSEGDQLHRRLGPVALMGLGIGATIGTGLYVQTGRVANEYAGPSLLLSFLLAAVGCGFAALCYSELASMVPVAGSAYTYAYATLGELLAWIIGWDLILEYAIGSSVVAAGWSNYLDAFLQNVFHFQLDPRIRSAPWDFNVAKGEFFLKYVTLADGSTALAWLNVPAILITAFVTVVLVVGVKESAGLNAAIVLLNIGVILTIIGLGSAYVDPRNWRPFLHEDKKWWGVVEGAGRIFFAYVGFDSISTHAEEARRPQRDLAIGIMGALTVCTILYLAVAAVLTGMVPYRQIDIQAPLSAALQGKGLTFAGGLITLGILAGMTSSLLVGNLSQPRILLAMARDGLLPPGIFAAIHPRFGTPWKSTILVGGFVAAAAALAPLEFLADLVSIGTLFAFVIVSAAVWILRITDPAATRPFRTPWVPVVATMGILVNGGMMFSLGVENWIRLFIWLVLGLLIYFTYGRHHSALRPMPDGPGRANDGALANSMVRWRHTGDPRAINFTPDARKGSTMRPTSVIFTATDTPAQRLASSTILALALLVSGSSASNGEGAPGAETPKSRAIAAIEKLGGKVFQDETAPDKPVIGVDLDETHASDADLAFLEQFPQLQSLSLDETQVTDAGLAHIARLTSLTELDLDETAIGDAGLVHIKALFNLRKLTATHTGVTDVGLAQLTGLKRLETLSLIGTKVSDAGLVYLKGLPRLEWLFLDHNPITDAGITHLKDLKSLEFLFLNRTAVTDAGLIDLEKMTNLEIVSLHNTLVTDLGASRLRKALPKAKVYH